MSKRRRVHPKSQEAKKARLEAEEKAKLRADREKLMNSGLFGGKTAPIKKRKKKNPDEAFDNPNLQALRKVKQHIRDSAKDIPSHGPKVPDEPSRSPVRYSGDMLEREQAAQEEIERKKRRVAPLYNKGGYQYVTDETDLSDLGRKK